MTGIISGNVTATTVLFAVVGVALTAKSYLEQVFIAVNKYPKAVTGSFVFGAFYFCYNLVVLSVSWTQQSYLQALYRGAFLFGAITMLFGPFLVLTPTHPIVLKKETLLKKMVRSAQKEETRYVTFACFCFLTLCQGFVVYAIYDVLQRLLHLEITMVLIICIFYGLISIFYLCVFWSVMMKRELVLMGINLLDVIRKKLVVEYREQEYDILAMKHFATAYVSAFLLLFVTALALIVTMFVFDCSRMNDMDSGTVWVIVLCFILHIVTLIVFAIFILNVAFHPINVSKSVDIDGVVIDVDMIKWTGITRIEDRLCLLDIVASNQPHNHLGSIRAALRNYLASSDMPTQHMAAAVIDVDDSARLHQLNDTMLAFFVATGIEYPAEVAQHYLWFLSREVIPLVSSDEVVQCISAFGLNYLLAETVSNLCTQFSDKKAMSELIKEAKKHQSMLEKIVAIDSEQMLSDNFELLPPSNTLKILASTCSKLANTIPTAPALIVEREENEAAMSTSDSDSSGMSSDYSNGSECEEEEMEINEIPIRGGKGGRGGGRGSGGGGRGGKRNAGAEPTAAKEKQVPQQQMPVKRKSFVQEQVERIEGKKKSSGHPPSRTRLGGRGDAVSAVKQQTEQDATLDAIADSLMKLQEMSANISSEMQQQADILDDLVDNSIDNASPRTEMTAPPKTKNSSANEKKVSVRKIKKKAHTEKLDDKLFALKSLPSVPSSSKSGAPLASTSGPTLALAPVPRRRSISDDALSAPVPPLPPSATASQPPVAPPSRSRSAEESKTRQSQLEYELLDEIRNNDMIMRAEAPEEDFKSHDEFDKLLDNLDIDVKPEVPRASARIPAQPTPQKSAYPPTVFSPSSFRVSPVGGFCVERGSNSYHISEYPQSECCIVYGESAVEKNTAKSYTFAAEATNLQNHSLYIGWAVSHADNCRFLAMGRWRELFFNSEHSVGLLTHDLSVSNNHTYFTFAGGTVLGKNVSIDKHYIGPLQDATNLSVSSTIRYIESSSGMQCLVSFTVANRIVFTASLPSEFFYVPVIYIFRNLLHSPRSGYITVFSSAATTRRRLQIPALRHLLLLKDLSCIDEGVCGLRQLYDNLSNNIMNTAMMSKLVQHGLTCAIQCVRCVTPLSLSQIQLLESQISTVIAASYMQWLTAGGPPSCVFSSGAILRSDEEKTYLREVESLYRDSITSETLSVVLQQILVAHAMRWVLLPEPASVLSYIDTFRRIIRCCGAVSPIPVSWQNLDKCFCTPLRAALQKIVYAHWNVEVPEATTFEIDTSPV